VYQAVQGSQMFEEISVWLWKIYEEGVIPLYLSHVDGRNSHSLPITFLCFQMMVYGWPPVALIG
jgi:hypothetical protein